jgi:hypothetical protein
MSDNTFSWRLRITGAESDAARVSARRHQFTVGRPIDFDAESLHVMALEYALGAVGAEIVTGLRVFAKRRRVELDHIEAVVDGHVSNALTYLEVVGAPGQPAVSRISIRVYISSPHDEPTVKRLWTETLERLPLVVTFGRVLDLSLELILSA